MRTAPEPDHVPAIYAPASFDLDRYLGRLNSQLLEHAHYRRLYCKTDPALFALLYFGDSALISAETGPDIQLAQFHLDMAEAAQRWIRKDLRPGELREAWIAPRGSGKSVWAFRVLLAWALAYQHRRFAFCVAYNDDQAKRHLRNLRRAFEHNELLRHDFPELCSPAKTNGRSVGNTQNEYIAASGAVVMAYGITSTQLGAVVGSVRPDLVVADDLEPPEGKYSPYQKENLQSTLINGVLGMNPNAIVQLCGTVTMYGSMTNDLVRSAHGEDVEWVREQNFRCRYYEPIVTAPDGSEASYWEAKYPLEYLRGIRGTRYYELNFLNMPRATKDGLFEPHDIVVRPARHVVDQVLWVDPGMTSKKTSDPTGLSVVSREATGNAVIEYAVGLRLKPDERKTIVGRICRENPRITTVYIDCTNGGDSVSEEIRPVLPSGVRLVSKMLKESKEWRFKRHLDYLQMGWISQAEEIPELERQMLAWPKVSHDDVLDAAAGGCDVVLADRPRALVRRR